MSISPEALKNTGLATASRIYTGLRQISSNQRAHAVLRAVESQRGPTARPLVRQADEYAREVLGGIKYAPWLHVYCAISGQFKEGWIPDNYYGLVVEPRKSGEAAKMAQLKSFTNRILNTEALPDLAYVIGGICYSRDYKPISEAQLLQTLFAEEARTVFKRDNSSQGRSVVFMGPEDLKPGTARRLPDGVFQAPIHQHPFLAEMSPTSTATLRVTSARGLDGSISIKAAYLRLGRVNDQIVACRSHVRVAVDTATGALSDEVYLHDWRKTDAHPDTGFRFAGQSVPNFAAAAALCKALHESCPHMLCLGWDLCIDDAGKVKIIEWNARYNDIKFSEATTGPCFRGLGWEDLWRSAAA
jgi:hypothetical protein